MKRSRNWDSGYNKSSRVTSPKLESSDQRDLQAKQQEDICTLSRSPETMPVQVDVAGQVAHDLQKWVVGLSVN